MEHISEAIHLEKLRLRGEVPATPSSPGVAQVQYGVRCKNSAEKVLSLAKEVLTAIDSHSEDDWPDLESWKKVLPTRFTAGFSTDLPKDELLAFHRRIEDLAPREHWRAQYEKGWSFADWLFWLEPQNRSWIWFEGVMVSDQLATVTIEPLEWPFPSGALRLLLIAAGAVDVWEKGEW